MLGNRMRRFLPLLSEMRETTEDVVAPPSEFNWNKRRRHIARLNFIFHAELTRQTAFPCHGRQSLV
jgi:hypothetical protein